MRRPTILSILTWTLATVLVAGIVHISSIFLLPKVTAQDAYTRLAAQSATNGFHLLPPPAPENDLLPFSDSGVMLAVCRYDLSAAAWRIRVTIDPETLTSLSFRSREGTVFHVLTDRAALRGRLDVLLGTASQIDAVEAADADETLSREVRLVSPSNVGAIFLRAMPASASGTEPLKQQLEAAECRGPA